MIVPPRTRALLDAAVQDPQGPSAAALGVVSAAGERVTLHLAGEEALRALHRETAAALGLPHDGRRLPLPRRGLPPSLRALRVRSAQS